MIRLIIDSTEVWLTEDLSNYLGGWIVNRWKQNL